MFAIIQGSFDNLPSNPTGVFCLSCFREVRSHAREGGVILFCGCYARFFEPGNDRYKNLTESRWQQYLDASEAKRLGEQLNSESIVNPAPLGCWCPACQRDRQIASEGVWLSPGGKRLIAKYGTCKACSRKYGTASKSSQEAIHKRCEAALLERYPNLKERIT